MAHVTVSVKSRSRQDWVVLTLKVLRKSGLLTFHQRQKDKRPSPRGSAVWGHVRAGISVSKHFPFYFCMFMPCRALVSI